MTLVGIINNIYFEIFKGFFKSKTINYIPESPDAYKVYFITRRDQSSHSRVSSHRHFIDGPYNKCMSIKKVIK